MITYTDEFGTTWTLGVTLDHYANNDNLYVGLVVAEDVYDEEGNIDSFAGEPYADLSINVRPLPENYIAVDCSYGPHDEFIEDNNLGTFTGRYMMSGPYGKYPVYELNIDEIKKHLIN